MLEDVYQVNILRYVVKKIKLLLYNKKHATLIHSINASLSATYGHRVMVEYGVVIAADVEIGDYSYVNRNSSLENCSIGKYVSISSGVYISPWEHPLNCITTHPIGYSESFKNHHRKRTIIGNDVLISLNCIILEGIRIGDGAVVGAGAVVTKDVEPYEVVAGVPAKHIKYRFDKEICTELLETEWWNLDKDGIDKAIKSFSAKSGGGTF